MSAGSVKKLKLYVTDGRVERVRVNMGRPILKASEIPVLSDEEQVLNWPVFVADRQWKMSCVSREILMRWCWRGCASLPLTEIGPKFENHSMFPERVNTEFIRIP